MILWPFKGQFWDLKKVERGKRKLLLWGQKNAQDWSTSDTSMVKAVMAAVDMKSAPALTVASVPDDPM